MAEPVSRLPIIDLAPFLRGAIDERRQVAAAVGRACRDSGFFYIKNHGIEQALIAQTFAQARRFFALPLAQKRAIAIEQSAYHRGYFALGGENLDPVKQRDRGDFKEGIKIGFDLPENHPLVLTKTPLHGPNQWPSERLLPGWRQTMQAYYDACLGLSRELMHALALALDLAQDYFDDYLTQPMATLGPLRYPPSAGEITEAQLGAGAHTDYGCLTVLAQDDTPGLQVKHAQGQWIDAPPLAGTFVVNIGDMMARWSNDLFASTQHRVINRSGRDRYSLPFFFDPSFDAPVVCLDTCRDADNPPKYPPTTGGQHLLDKINESFDYHRERAAESMASS